MAPSSLTPPTVGLVVNPIAGLGGQAGLHGTDAPDAPQRALSLGIRPMASIRAAAALAELDDVKLLTAGGVMGADAALLAGHDCSIIYTPPAPRTEALDTRRAVTALRQAGADLILFAGGDGTARDVMQGADGAPALGVPAGVKMHSSVFALSPRAAGVTARHFLATPHRPTSWREVLDVDFHWQPVLHGEMRVPDQPRRVQRPKQRLSAGENLAALGHALAEELEEGVTYLVGPGRTAKSVLGDLGLETGLLGVDVLRDRRVVRADASEDQLAQALSTAHKLRLLISPVGGQGFLLGRGNQQLSTRILKRTVRDGMRVASPLSKLMALGGRPLLIETDDVELATLFRPYVRVLIAPGREILYPVRIEYWKSPRRVKPVPASTP